MHLHDSRVNSRNTSNSSFRTNPSINSTSNGGSILIKNRTDNDGKSASAMSNLSSYSLIDDDHIDDQETINVGNLIIDLESDLEKEKIENEQQANSKTAKCSTTTNIPTSTFGAKASSSTNSFNTNSISSATTTTSSGKSNQKSSNKHSNSNVASNIAISSTGGSGSGGGGGSSSSSSSNSNHSGSSSNSSSSSSISAINSSTSNIINNNCTNNINSSNSNPTTARSVFKSSADERGELKMRITRETKPGKSEHKIVTSPNQKSPTSSSGSNSNNSNNVTSHANICEDNSSHELNIRPSQSSSISSTKECGTSTSIGTITEPECLGPCEPGTSVTLEGIVWQETEGGILVVNVTWRGKTYVGALLDCTKHDWAPPRLCDSPASDIDSKAHKGVRTKRIVTRSNGIGLDEKNLLQTTGKLRNGKGRRILSPNELASCNKRQRDSEKSNENIAAQSEINTSLPSVSSISNSETTSVPMNVDTALSSTREPISTSNILTDKVRPESPTLIDCNEPKCSKKFRNLNGLLYHQAHAHSAENDSSNNVQDSSLSMKEKHKRSDNDQLDDQKELVPEVNNESCRNPNDLRQDEEIKLPQAPEPKRTPSPQLSIKMSNKLSSELQANNNISTTISGSSSTTSYNTHRSPEPRSISTRNPDIEKRAILNPNQCMSNLDHSRKSPSYKHSSDYGHGMIFNSHSSSKVSSNSSKQSNPAPLPMTTEEGMKPSGTSTGPPPAPHQQNCYFNPHFLANTLNPYALGPYFPRSPLPMYDPLAPATSTANAAFLSRFMNNMRVPPPPESPSRLLSPSVGKNIPFPPYKMDTGILPNPQMTNPSLPNLSTMTNPPLATGSPHLRMPSQSEPMLPPTSQPPYPLPAGLNSVMGLPGSVNLIGPMGGPQVPSLVDDPLAKQFPRRFN